MRHYLVLIVSAILLYCHADGQADRFDPGKLHIGIKGGLNVTAIAPQNNYGQVLMDYKVPIRPMVGVSIMYQTGKRTQLVVEANYQVMGQNHEVFARKTDFEKYIKQQYLYFPVLFKFVLNKPEGVYGSAATFYNTHWYLTGGIQPGVLLGSDIRYEINDSETDFISFITEGGNPNLDQIESMEPPTEDEELYTEFDLGLTGGAGLFKRINARWQVFAELRGGISIIDVNAEEWRLPAGSGNYFASYNMFFGVEAGLAYKLF